MRLSTLTDSDFNNELLTEAPRKSVVDEPIKQPYGISDEEFTLDYQARLKDYQKRRPDLYHKIVNGL